MYRLTVHIPNSPLLIRREFLLPTIQDVDRVTAFCVEHGLTYEYASANTHDYRTAQDVIEQELALAAAHRVA